MTHTMIKECFTKLFASSPPAKRMSVLMLHTAPAPCLAPPDHAREEGKAA